MATSINSSSEKSAEQKPKWRLRFSLRTFFVVVIVIGICVGPWMHRAQRQEKAVNAIQRVGGSVYYRHQEYEGTVGVAFTGEGHPTDRLKGIGRDYGFTWNEPIWPAWIRTVFGDHCFFTPKSVKIGGRTQKKIEGKVLDCLSDLPSVERLIFLQVELSQENCRKIGSLKRLRLLSLGQHSSKDDPIKDFGFLADLPNLRVFQSQRSQFGDGGASMLAEKKQMKIIFVDFSAISDDGLVHFSNLRKLEILGLSGNKISDEGIRNLNGLPSLKYLSLTDTNLTDNCVRHLANLKSLRRLELRRTQLTNTGVKELEKQLPNCEIVR